MDVLERLKICASGGSIVPNRKLCGDAYDEIARLTAELAQARAAEAAAYDRAADSIQTLANQLWPDGKRTELADHIRALATEPGTTALAEIVKKAVEDS